MGGLITTLVFLPVVQGLYARDVSAAQWPEPDTLTVGEVVILSDHVKKSRVILPTDRISRARLEQFSPATLTEAVNLTPGVYIQSGALNTNRITIRGVGSRTLYGTNKIRAYFNGIPVTSGIGETTIDSYDPEDLENIEIIKGPKATEFGTNLGGTILLNPVEPGPGEFSLKNNATAGSFGLFKNMTTVNYGDDQLAVHLHYDHMQSEGFRENSDYNRNGWLLHTTVATDENSEVSLLFQQISYSAQIASSIGKTTFEEDPSQAALNWKSARGYEDDRQTLGALSFSRRLSRSFHNTTSLFYTDGAHYEPRPFNILDETTSGFGVRSVFSHAAEPWKNGEPSVHFGGEWYADQYDWETRENLYEQNNGKGSLEGELLSRNREFRNYFNVFVSAILPLTLKLKAQAGLNFNMTAYDYNDRLNTGTEASSATRKFDPVLAPSLSLSYQLGRAKKGYVNVSRGFNYPGLEETLTPEGVLNPEIGPEKGWNYEAGTDLFFFGEKLQINLAAYLLRIKGLLVAQRTGEDQYIGRNAGKTRHRGIELATRYRMDLFSPFTVSPFLHASLNFHEFVAFVDQENDYSGNDLTGVPERRISGGIQFSYRDRLSLYTGYEHTGSMPMNDANTLYSDAYNLFNLKISYRAKLSKRFSMEANAGVNNLTDEKYASSILINAVGFGDTEPRYYYPGLPRNYYGGVKVRYDF